MTPQQWVQLAVWAEAAHPYPVWLDVLPHQDISADG